MALKVTSSYIPHIVAVNTSDPVLNQWSRELINRTTDQFTTIAQRLNKAFLVDGSESITGITRITNTTDATSTTTGALVVSGGVGIAKQFWVGGNAFFAGNITTSGFLVEANTTDATSVGTGSVQLSGGLSVVKQIWTSGNITSSGILAITNATDATAIGTGAVVVTGGLSVAKQARIAGELTITGGSASAAAFNFGTAATLATSPLAGDMEYDGTCHYSTHSVNERGVLDSEQFISTQGTTFTLTSTTAAQKIFNSPANGQVTVKAATTYQYECWVSLTALSATSGSFGFALGGTATVTFSNWWSLGFKSALAAGNNPSMTYNNASVANTTIVTATGNTVGCFFVKGTIRINAAGTLIPQVSLGVAAPAVVGQDSWFRIWPVGNNVVTSLGNWS